MEKNYYNLAKSLIDSYLNFEKFGKGEVEIESRIKKYGKDIYGITYKGYVNIQKHFEKYLKEKINSIDYTNYEKEKIDEIEYNTSTRKEIYEDREIYIKKYTPNLFKYDLRGVKFTVSYEQIKDKAEEYYKFTRIKERNRYLYNHKGTEFIIDLTKINKGEIYELELVVNNLENLKTSIYQDFIEFVLKILYDTENFYNLAQYLEIIKFFNNSLKSKEENEFDSNVLYQPRNLKITDLKYGGLIGHEFLLKEEKRKEIYTVSFKADGLRKILITYNNNLWLIYPPDEANLIIKNIPSEFNNYILDGELIPKISQIKPINEKYWFLSFDCLYDPKDNYEIETYDYLIRLLRAGKLDNLGSSLIRINSKNKQGEFKELTDVEKFYDVMNEMENLKTLINYKTDGYIFTPIYMAINDFKKKIPLKDRELTKYKDICKWKPPEQISIDFKYKNGRLWSVEKGEDVLFTGNNMYHYDGKLIDKFNGQKLQNGEIVEFVYIDKVFKPIRIRYDKMYPNALHFALDNWNLIHYPINLNTMLGKSIELMRRYHNSIKAYLFNETYRTYNNVKTLLDIGSGRGGDIFKWRGFEKIIAVEPDKDNIEELKSRITNIFNQLDVLVITKENFENYKNICYEANLNKHKIIILNMGGEDYEYITKVQNSFTGGPCDITALMLSLSFFWKSEEMLNNLVNTINLCTKDSGRVIFMTINGNCLKQAFNEPEYIKLLENVGVTISKNGEEININIKDSIVENQIEYYVKITDLVKKLKFELKEHKLANNEKFLNKYELILTSLYSYGYFEN